MYQGAIFDLDGVLVDTAELHYSAWKSISDELGFTFTKKDNERLKGVSRMESLEILLSIGHIKSSQEEKDRLADVKNVRYVKLLHGLTEKNLLPGAEECLLWMRERQIKTALGSASKNAPFILQQLGIKELFDAVADGNEVQKAKPNPEIFLLAAEKLGIPCSACVVFEDSAAGIEAAGRAGMKTVGIGKAEYLSAADIVVGSLQEYLAEPGVRKGKA